MFHKGLVLHGVSTVSAGITIAAQSTILTPSLSLNHRHDKKLSKYYKLVKICPPPMHPSFAHCGEGVFA